MTNFTTIHDIARKRLDITTLEGRGSDSLDFHAVSVDGVKQALRDAVALGRATALRHAYSKRGFDTVADAIDMELIPAETIEEIMLGLRSMPDELRTAAKVQRELANGLDGEDADRVLVLADDLDEAADELDAAKP